MVLRAQGDRIHKNIDMQINILFVLIVAIVIMFCIALYAANLIKKRYYMILYYDEIMRYIETRIEKAETEGKMAEN